MEESTSNEAPSAPRGPRRTHPASPAAPESHPALELGWSCPSPPGQPLLLPSHCPTPAIPVPFPGSLREPQSEPSSSVVLVKRQWETWNLALEERMRGSSGGWGSFSFHDQPGIDGLLPAAAAPWDGVCVPGICQPLPCNLLCKE